MFYGDPNDRRGIEGGFVKFAMKNPWIWLVIPCGFGLVELYRGADGIFLRLAIVSSILTVFLSVFHYLFGTNSSEADKNRDLD